MSNRWDTTGREPAAAGVHAGIRWAVFVEDDVTPAGRVGARVTLRIDWPDGGRAGGAFGSEPLHKIGFTVLSSADDHEILAVLTLSDTRAGRIEICGRDGLIGTQYIAEATASGFVRVTLAFIPFSQLRTGDVAVDVMLIGDDGARREMPVPTPRL